MDGRAGHAGRRVLGSVLVALILAVSLAIAPGGRFVVAAQDATATVAMTGDTIVASDPWQVVAHTTVSETNREAVVLSGTNDNLVFGSISAEASSADPIADVLGVYAGTVGPLTDVDSNSRYAFQAAEINGVTYGMFSLIYTNRNPGVIEVRIYLSPVSTFADGFASAQGSVLVDNRPIFTSVNGRTLQALVAQQVGMGEAATEASLAPPLNNPPVVVEEDVPTANTVATPVLATPTMAVGTPVAGEPTAPAETPPAATPGEEVSPPPATPGVAVPEATPVVMAPPVARPVVNLSVYAGVGLIEDGHYISPQFGTVIQWDERWTVAPSDNDSSVTSDLFTRTDRLVLVSTTSPGVIVVVSIWSSFDFGMADWVRAFETRNLGDFPEVLSALTTTSGVAVLESRDTGELFLFDVSTSSAGATFRELELSGPGAVVPGMLGADAGGITVDGTPAFVEITQEELTAAQDE